MSTMSSEVAIPCNFADLNVSGMEVKYNVEHVGYRFLIAL